MHVVKMLSECANRGMQSVVGFRSQNKSLECFHAFALFKCQSTLRAEQINLVVLRSMKIIREISLCSQMELAWRTLMLPTDEVYSLHNFQHHYSSVTETFNGSFRNLHPTS